MSHHGLQVLYSLMNDDGLGLRAGLHAAARLRGRPAAATACRSTASRRSRRCDRFDVLGFSLQYEICYTNVLTMLDLGGIALHAEDRGPDDTLVIAGGPGAQNPELLAPFIDLFVIGDGEPSLPVVCELWKVDAGLGPVARRTSWRGSPAASTGPTSRGSTSRSTTTTARSPRSAGPATTCPRRSSRA